MKKYLIVPSHDNPTTWRGAVKEDNAREIYINDYNLFVRVVLEFLEQGENWDLCEEIRRDSTFYRIGPDHYGLTAISLAENWLRSQKWEDLPEGSYDLALVQKPNQSSASLLPVRVNSSGNLEYFLKNLKTLPLPEDWLLIAFSRRNNQAA